MRRLIDTLAHTQAEDMLQVAREYLRRHNLKPGALLVIDDPSPVNVRPTSVVEPSEVVVSADYEHADVDAEVRFDSYTDWMDYFDTYIGAMLRKRLAGTYVLASGLGHLHSGTDGDGAPIDPGSVFLGAGSIAGPTAREHIYDRSVHSAGAPIDDVSAPGIWCDFEEGEVGDLWTVSAGVAMPVDVSGNTALDLAAGTTVRLRSPDGAWSDNVLIEFDLWIDPSYQYRRVEVFLRHSEGMCTVFRLSGYSASSIYTWNGSVYTEIRKTGSPPMLLFSSSVVFKRVRLIVSGQSLAMWPDFNGALSAASRRITGADPNQPDTGFVDITAFGHAVIDNIFISRCPAVDASDLTDAYSVFVGGSIPAVNHAARHRATGDDAIDVTDLANPSGRLLTVSEKDALLAGGPSNNPHTHTDKGVEYSSLMFYTHARDALLHSATGISETDFAPTVPNAVADYQAGSHYRCAYGQHSHGVPCWMIERCAIYAPSGSMSGRVFAKPVDFTADDGLERVTDCIAALTVTGEYSDSGYDPGCLYLSGLARDGYSLSEVHRLRLPLLNTEDACVTRRFMFPVIGNSLWVTVWSEQNGLMPFPGLATFRQSARSFETVDVSIYPGWNDIIVYVAKNSWLALGTIIVPTTPMFGQKHDIALSYPDDGVTYRPVGFSSDDPAFLAPEAYVTGVR